MNIKILAITLVFIFIIGQSCLSTISNDWICIPGQRVGPILKETDKETLVEIFGASNVKTITTGPDENLGTPGRTYTYIYSNTKNEIKITWQEQKPWIISIYKDGTQWRTVEGITIGTSLEEVVKINKNDFLIAGYGWEYGGWVASWNDGELAKKYKDNLQIFFDEGNGKIWTKEYIGDKIRIKSDNKQLLSSKPKVDKMEIVF